MPLRFRSLIFWISIITMASLNPMSVQAQNSESYSVYEKKVRTLENFIERFNNLPEGSGMPQPGIPIQLEPERYVNNRFNNLYSLFDHQIFTGAELARNTQVAHFIKEVNSLDHQQYLNLSSPGWGAEIQIRLNEPPFEVLGTLYLHHLADPATGKNKWVLRAVAIRAMDLHEIFISPTIEFPGFIHGTHFIPIKISLKDPKWIEQNLTPDGKPSTFMSALHSQKLKITQVEDPVFSFYQIKGWRFLVCYRNRDSRNSGWLIFKLDSMAPDQAINELKFKGLPLIPGFIPSPPPSKK